MLPPWRLNYLSLITPPLQAPPEESAGGATEAAAHWMLFCFVELNVIHTFVSQRICVLQHPLLLHQSSYPEKENK